MSYIDTVVKAHDLIGRGVLELQVAARSNADVAKDVAAMQPEIEALGDKLFALVEKVKAIPDGFDARNL